MCVLPVIRAMMEAVCTSETSVYFKETTRRYIPEGCQFILQTSYQALASLFETDNNACCMYDERVCVHVCMVTLKVHAGIPCTESANAWLKFLESLDSSRQGHWLAGSHGGRVVWQPGSQVDNTVEGGQGLHPRRSPVLPIPLPPHHPSSSIHPPSALPHLKNHHNLHTEEVPCCRIRFLAAKILSRAGYRSG
jgi:hypothetical protein